jgi:hypothetical protein
VEWQDVDMRQKASRIAVAVLASVALWVGVAAAARAVPTLKLSRWTDQLFEARSERIEREISRLEKHQWAGKYQRGLALGDNTWLAIAPQEGFVFQERGCVGVYDRNMGSVAYEKGRLKLSFLFHNDDKSPLTAEIIPVPWGQRMYLVGQNQMHEFCDSVNRGREPRNMPGGEFFLRRGDEAKRVNGFPAVPQEFKNLLIKHRIDGDIVAIGASTNRPSVNNIGFTDTTVTIDIGTSDGVRVGRVFYISKPFRNDDTVEITEVSSNRCEGFVIQNGSGQPPPSVGWKISTRPWPWF